jgi:hypothetical protein
MFFVKFYSLDYRYQQITLCYGEQPSAVAI